MFLIVFLKTILNNGWREVEYILKPMWSTIKRDTHAGWSYEQVHFLIHFDQNDKHSHPSLNPLYFDPSPIFFFWFHIPNVLELFARIYFYVVMQMFSTISRSLYKQSQTIISLVIVFPINFLFLKIIPHILF